MDTGDVQSLTGDGIPLLKIVIAQALAAPPRLVPHGYPAPVTLYNAAPPLSIYAAGRLPELEVRAGHQG